jgi:GNAT superfamily N-acetyltransferase
MILGLIDTHYFSDDKFLSEYFVYVDKDKRGSSIGLKLLKKWLEWGQLYGVEDVWMQYSTDINKEKTHKFFQKIGFNKIGYIYNRS